MEDELYLYFWPRLSKYEEWVWAVTKCITLHQLQSMLPLKKRLWVWWCCDTLVFVSLNVILWHPSTLDLMYLECTINGILQIQVTFMQKITNYNKPYSFGNDAWRNCSHFDCTCKSLIVNSKILRMVEYTTNKTYNFNEINQLKLSTTINSSCQPHNLI